MRSLWIGLCLVLSAGCFGKYKKGIVTAGSDSFSGAAEVRWQGWLQAQGGPGAGLQTVGLLVGAGSTVDNVDTTLVAAGAGQHSATLTARWAMVGTESAYKNESAIPWRLKGCGELEVKIGSGATLTVPATWDGRLSGGDPVETVQAEVPAEALAGLESEGVLAVRACGSIAASTDKQTASLKEWASKASLTPAPRKVAPISAPASIPAL